MNPKKSTKADLEGKKFIFRQVGLVVALAVVLLAFEWKTYEKSVEGFGDRVVEDIPEEMVEITVQEKKPPPPPPPKKVVVLNVVEDDIEVEDEIQIDVEADEETEVEEYIPIEVEEEVEEEAPIFIVVESMPQFPGGEEKLYEYLGNTMKYPQMAKESQISGTVYVTFVIEKNGSVTDARILRGIGGGCDEEALRVVRAMPKWSPGKQRGKPVRVQYNLPVRFILQ